MNVEPLTSQKNSLPRRPQNQEIQETSSELLIFTINNNKQKQMSSAQNHNLQFGEKSEEKSQKNQMTLGWMSHIR